MEKSSFDNSVKKINQNLLLIILTVVFTGLAILTAYQPVWANVPINVIIPLIVLIRLKPVFFERLKLSTLVVLRILVLFAAIGLLDGNFYAKLALVFLIINIMEATITDFKKKKYFNSITGLALCISIFWMSASWVDKGMFKGYYIAGFEIGIATVLWWIAYTIWNWFFVTNEFSPSIAKYHIGVLSAPLIGSLITMNPAMWLILRANSLTIAGFIQIGKKDTWEDALQSDHFSRFVSATQTTTVQIIFMIINLALVLASVLI